ncbi:MAG: hypothetical protein KGY66_07800 [Candidatus Thermoplasmatota archaeon]|nr:hypothetical protein [Candidatus Thermoplasmatota archaeon]MBS3790802.1 hypothetical protein [Candidatus Thermoplasmatota archaeon]
MTIILGSLFVILVFLTGLAMIGDPGGFWMLGSVGVQVFLVILGIIGVIGILDMLGGVVILGSTTALALFVVPLLY